jgi:DNA recombination protein RmuC
VGVPGAIRPSEVKLSAAPGYSITHSMSAGSSGTAVAMCRTFGFGARLANCSSVRYLSPEQFLKNAQVRENSQERVEFAIRLPGRDADGEVLLPVDAKFPHDDYERLLSAAEAGDAETVAEASKALENRIRVCAKTIRDKYIIPPRTTDFAILFLPTESLYAEVLRRPGLFENIQREYHVTLAGPSTFIALLNALQMGFRSLAIEKRSS